MRFFAILNVSSIRNIGILSKLCTLTSDEQIKEGVSTILDY
jgi:hypothetical protein